MTDAAADGSTIEPPKSLFNNVKYYLVGNIDKKIEDMLKEGGGKRDHYLSEMCTYVICDDPTEPDCSEARELFELPVVTSHWVVVSVRCKKLLPVNAFAPENNNLFSGIKVCPSQLTMYDQKIIWGLVTYNGGMCSTRFDRTVTHLVTGAPNGAKYNCALRHGDRVKTVTPDWVHDCIRGKTLIDETRYHPRLLLYEAPKAESPMETESTGLTHVSQSTPSTPTTPGSTSPKAGPHSAKTKEALARIVNNRLYAMGRGPGEDLDLPPVPRPPHPIGLPPQPRMPGHMTRPMSPRALRNITNNEGIRSPRSPRIPRMRSPGRSPKINQLMSNMSPYHRPLSPGAMGYPQMPFGGNMPLMPQRIQLFGHDPNERVPESLCLVGCVFYITDYKKYLEKSQLDTWKKVIQQNGGQIDESYSNRVTHVMCENQKSDVFKLAVRDGKRLVTAHWLNDVLTKKKLLPPWTALHMPIKYERPCTNQIICVTNFEGEDRNRVKQMISLLGAKYTGYMTNANSVLVAKKPTGVKYDKALEWRVPVVNVNWLSDLLMGELRALKLPLSPRYQNFATVDPFAIEVYKLEHMLEGWKHAIRISKDVWKMFSTRQLLPTPPTSDSQNTPGSTTDSLKRKAEDSLDPPEKKLKLESPTPESIVPPPSGVVVLITGIPKSRAGQLTQQIESLGGAVSTTATGCTHLLAANVARTVKFLTALSVVKHIVVPEWVEHCMKENKFVDENNFILKDINAEAQFNFNLSESLKRATEKKLFQAIIFYMTPSVIPGKKTLSEIITNAGGKVVDRRPSIRLMRKYQNEQGQPTFITITCENDLHLVQDLTSREIAVYNAEFVLTGVIKQEISYDAYAMSPMLASEN